MSPSSFRFTLDLAGTWQLAFDPYGRALEHGWTRGNFPVHADTEQVPAIWEILHPDVQGVGFYRRTFVVPHTWAERVVRLHFGGASYRADVWLNGVYVGGHEGAYTGFSFDVGAQLRFDAENELVVRVAGLSRAQAVDGRVLEQVPASKQSWYYIYSGLWGAVTLEASAPTALNAVRIEPNLAQEWARVEVTLTNALERHTPAQLVVTLCDADGVVAAQCAADFTLPPGKIAPAFRMAVPHPRAWSTETPHLYHARAALMVDGQTVDGATTRFGMRDFTVREGEFFLNGAPLYLRGVLLQPNYPVQLIVPPSAEMLRQDLTLAKAAGFNLIRAHLRPSPAGFLDLADELGMLVYAESSIAWMRANPRLEEHCRRELTALIERDRNHPAVVIWGIHNENRAANEATGEMLIRHVRSLDPTRVVLDHSGGSLTIDQDFGWIDRTTVVPNRETARQPFQDVHVYVGSPIPDGVYAWLRTLGETPPPVDLGAYNFGAAALFQEWARELRDYHGKVFVSELGCGGMADLEQVVAGYGDCHHLVDAREMANFRDDLNAGFRERRLERVFGSVANLVRAAQAMHAAGTARQVEALLANPRVSGYSITQWNDVAWEFHAGLVDPWRQPKAAYYAAQRVHEPHHLILKAERSVSALRSVVQVAVTLVHQIPLGERAEVVLRVLDPQGYEVRRETRTAPSRRGVNECGWVAVASDNQEGHWRLVGQLQSGDRIISETTEQVLFLLPPDLTASITRVTWVGPPPPELAELAPEQSDSSILFAAQPALLREADCEALLASVAGGETAIIEALEPRHDAALRALGRRGITLDLHYGIGNWMPCYHWQPQTLLFQGLPAGGLATEPYADVLPWYVPIEPGGETLAGSFRNTQTRLEAPRMLWYSDVVALPLGRGTLILNQYRLANHLANPLAARMLCNLLEIANGYARRNRGG